MTTLNCTFDGCFRLSRTKKGGLCASHLAQRYRGSGLTAIRAYKPKQPKPEPKPKQWPSLVRDGQGRKRCGPCGQWLPVDQFYAAPKPADGLSGVCTKCSNLVRFKLTRTSYEALLASQDGCCAFCSKQHTEDEPLRVDHDHNCCPGRGSCGSCVRWLLCNGCNSGLGQFAENEAALLAAVEQLRAWRTR